MSDLNTLYEQMQDSANDMTKASVEMKLMMTEDEDTDVPIEGYGPKPSFSKQIKEKSDEINEMFEKGMYGYILLDSFQAGNTILYKNHALHDLTSTEYFRWDGAIPVDGKVVPPGSTPTPQGPGGWISVGDASLRSELAAPGGVNLVNGAVDQAHLAAVDGAALVGSGRYADIRAYLGAAAVMDCSGKAAAGDGAQGRFNRDPSDTTSADNGCTILVDALGRRWKREHTPGEVNLLWATGKIAPGVAYTAEFEAAAAATSATTNGNLADMRCGKLKMPGLDVLVRNAFVRNPGLVLDFPSNGIGRLVCDVAGVALTVHPLRGDDTPYTNTGYGGFFINNGQIAAVSDEARNSGVGLLLINCFNTQFINQYVSGFKQNIMLRGSHFAQFRNFYAADEKNSPTNPNEEIFNRGYALVIDPTPASGETESTGLVIDGGWFHNTSLDLSFGSNYTLKNVDIEPASNTVYLGHKGHVHDCRFERMDYYAVNADPPKYAPFPWFHVVGNGNLIEHNEIHSLGATNNPAVNPKFFVPSNDNTFIFDKDGIRFGLIKLGPTTLGNHVEIGKFKDLQYFAAGAESPFYVENVHIYEGFNTHKLSERRSYVESFFNSYNVKNCASVAMPGAASIQGLTKSGDSFIVDGSATHRIICNFNSTTKYTPGMYCLKFRLGGYSDNITINIVASYLKASSHAMPMQGMNDGYSFVRFQIVGTEDLVMPTFNIFGASPGDSFTLKNVELLRFDSGEYVKSEYIL